MQICTSLQTDNHASKPHGHTSPIFVDVIYGPGSVLLRRGVAMRYVFPVLWMTSLFYTMGQLDVGQLQCLVEFIRMWYRGQSLLSTIDLFYLQLNVFQ